MNHFKPQNKKEQPHNAHGHQFGHPTTRGGQVTSDSKQNSGSAYGLSVGNTNIQKRDGGYNTSGIETHRLQHADYDEVTGGDYNSVTGNSQYVKGKQ